MPKGETLWGMLPPGLRKLGSESARYLVVSAFALGCDVAIYATLIQRGLVASIAGALGYAAGLLVHYALSSNWVFPDADRRRRAIPTLAKFVATGLFGLALTTAIIGGLTGFGLAGAFPAKAIAVGGTYVAVFLLRRTYVFAAAPRR